MSIKAEELPQVQSVLSAGHFEAVVVAITTGDSAKLPPNFQTSCRTLTAEPSKIQLKVPKLSSFEEWAKWWGEQTKCIPSLPQV